MSPRGRARRTRCQAAGHVMNAHCLDETPIRIHPARLSEAITAPQAMNIVAVALFVAAVGLAFLAPARAGKPIHIAANKLAFSPAHVSARVGDTVEWVSTDFIAHTATTRNRDWDILVPAHDSGKIVLIRSGEVDHLCCLNSSMASRILVAPWRQATARLYVFRDKGMQRWSRRASCSPRARASASRQPIPSRLQGLEGCPSDWSLLADI